MSPLSFNEFVFTEDYSEWEAAVRRQLKGAGADTLPKSAVGINGYYKALDAPKNMLEGVILPTHPTVPAFRFEIKDNETLVNKQILGVLNLGVGALVIQGEGLIDFETLLQDIHTDYIDLHIQTSASNLSANAYHLNTYLKENGRTTFTGSFTTPQNSIEKIAELAQLDCFSKAKLALFKSGSADISSQISDLLIQANSFVESGIKQGKNIDELSALMLCNYSISSVIVENIAALRAIRKLWAVLINSYKPQNWTSTYCNIYTENQEHTFESQQKGYTNISAQTTAHTTALLGNANTHVFKGFDLSKQLPISFSQRVSSNISNVLLEEGFLGLVHDPLAGSYSVEKATEKLMKETWASFANLQ